MRREGLAEGRRRDAAGVRGLAVAALCLAALATASGPSAAGVLVRPGASAPPRIGALAARRARLDSLDRVSSGPIEVRFEKGTVDPVRVRRLAADLDAAAAAMVQRLPLDPIAPLTVVVEPDFVAQALRSGAIGPAVPGAPADLEVVLDGRDLWAQRYALALLLLHRSGLFPEAAPWLGRGAALWLAGDWYGRPWRDWLATLGAAGALPTCDELLAAEIQPDASEPLWTPAAAAVVDRLPGVTIREKIAVLPGEPAVRALLARWARSSPSRAAAGERRASAGFLRGVSLAMRNSLVGGYHAPALDARLDHLRALGSDAVALMPFAYEPAADEPELRFLDRHPRSETAVGLVHAARAAHARGFRVLWKPQIWVGHDAWTGEIRMRSEVDWRRWWEVYRRFILHHAFLARWAGSDLFSIGVELGGTLGHAGEWHRLVADVRTIFPGALTYSANWGPEAEKVPFWADLDFVGVDAYYPLSTSPAPGDEALASGARAVVRRLSALAAAHGKPVLLTEVGFAARPAPWREPHEEGGAFEPEDQARAYRALLGALDHPPWLAGLFVWKAFSAAAVGSDGESADFTFLGRPAEEVIRGYFERSARPRSSVDSP